MLTGNPPPDQPFTRHPLTAADRPWVTALICDHWGGPTVVSRGVAHHVADCPGFYALAEGKRIGLITYHITGRACEIVTLDSMRWGIGVGVALIEAVKGAAITAGCTRLWLITTNDNTHALRFYQRQGFVLAALHVNALAESRKLKPGIPLVGMDGIILRDEIELAMDLLI